MLTTLRTLETLTSKLICLVFQIYSLLMSANDKPPFLYFLCALPAGCMSPQSCCTQGWLLLCVMSHFLFSSTSLYRLVVNLSAQPVRVAKWVEHPSPPPPLMGDRGNLKVAGSNLDLTVLNPGRVKPMTFKLILVAPYPDAQHYYYIRIGQGLSSSLSG